MNFDRFIPAYAGNSSNNRIQSITSTVHPRLRGELFCSRDPMSIRIGSSPLTRGTPVKE